MANRKRNHQIALIRYEVLTVPPIAVDSASGDQRQTGRQLHRNFHKLNIERICLHIVINVISVPL